MSVIKDDPLTTALVGEKTTKLDSRETFFGMCDELSCHIMEIRCMIEDNEIKEELLDMVKTLSGIMGEIAGGKYRLEEYKVVELIELKKKYEFNNGIIKEFVMPGQNLLSARIHITRCVCRRCELSYARVFDEYNTSKIIFEYLNKLSLVLYFLAERFETHE